MLEMADQTPWREEKEGGCVVSTEVSDDEYGYVSTVSPDWQAELRQILREVREKNEKKKKQGRVLE